MASSEDNRPTVATPVVTPPTVATVVSHSPDGLVLLLDDGTRRLVTGDPEDLPRALRVGQRVLLDETGGAARVHIGSARTTVHGLGD